MNWREIWRGKVASRQKTQMNLAEPLVLQVGQAQGILMHCAADRVCYSRKLEVAEDKTVRLTPWLATGSKVCRSLLCEMATCCDDCSAAKGVGCCLRSSGVSRVSRLRGACGGGDVQTCIVCGLDLVSRSRSESTSRTTTNTRMLEASPTPRRRIRSKTSAPRATLRRVTREGASRVPW